MRELTASLDHALIALPSGASNAIRATAAQYLAWLSLVDYRLWLDYEDAFFANVERAACAIPWDDAVAFFLNAAPLWGLFLSETAHAAKVAVLADQP